MSLLAISKDCPNGDHNSGQLKQCSKRDSSKKGYQPGLPALELKCKVGDHTDGLAIKLKTQEPLTKQPYFFAMSKFNVLGG